MGEVKYNLSAPTAEEQDAFMKEFNDLCKKHSIYFEPVPMFNREKVGAPWQIICQIFLQKKIEVVKAEIVSDNPEVNPTI